MTTGPTRRPVRGRRFIALAPLLLLTLVVGAFIAWGSSLVGLVGHNPPAADEFDIRRVEFRPGEIRVLVRNPQQDDLTIANVNVDDAIVPFELDGERTLARLRSSTVVVAYDWVENDPITVGITSSTGIETTRQVAAAVLTPTPSAGGFLGYGLIGLLVGVVPVALGLLWLPSLRDAGERWITAFMALTAGLLTFLAVDALVEAFTLQQSLPSALGGPGLVLLGVAGSYVGMTLLSERLARGRAATGLTLAVLIAVGIGVHNMGEGLAIGTSFALGELQLGSFLIVGFMVHNISEGLAIAAPLSQRRVSVPVLGALALIAGAPAIAGAWIGGYVTNEVLGVLFFAVAAGAAGQVIVEVVRHISRTAPGGVRSSRAVGGFAAGIAVMYATGLVAG